MMTVKLMYAKLHRLRVTEAHLDYMGSITLDRTLIEAVGIFPLQEVQVVNVTNGHRLTTYVIPGKPGSGCVEINGAAAHLCQPGDEILVIAYAECDRQQVLEQGHHAKVLIADEQNHCQQLLEQTLIPHQQGIEWSEKTIHYY